MKHIVNYFLLLMTGLLLSFQVAAQSTSNLTARLQLSATNQTVLSSQIAGKIAQVAVKAGETFKKGQTLFNIDCDIQKAQREKARAELLIAKANYQVQKQLEQLNSGSTLDIKLAEAGIKKARADLSMIDIGIKMCRIKAPFNGQVVERMAEPHQYVAVGESILEIIDNQHLEVNLIVPSKWLAWLKKGQQFSIQLDDNQRSYSAVIVRIGAKIDSASRSLNVIGQIDGKTQGLVAGMSGTASFNVVEIND